jgi:regulatory protein
MRKEPFPGRISAVVAQQKLRRGLGRRVNVFIEDRFSFALDAGLAIDRGLRPGLVLDADALNGLLHEDGDARAYARALSFLGYRPRAEKEIRDRLARDEWPESVTDRVIEKLRTDGLVDDAAFATLWADSRGRTRGSMRLSQELRQKGVGKEEIEAALPDADTETGAAVEAARRKWESYAGLEARERREKTLQWLQRRGFNFNIARAAVRVLQEEG